MRPFFTLLLLALLACHFAGFWVLPLANLADVRARAEQRLSEKNGADGAQTTFSISKKDFRQSRFGKREIMFRGQVFDMVRFSETTDSVQVVAVHDAREQKMLAHFQRLFNPSEAGLPDVRGPFSRQMAHFLAQPFLVPEVFGTVFLPSETGGPTQVFSHLLMPRAWVAGVVSPPPEV